MELKNNLEFSTSAESRFDPDDLIEYCPEYSSEPVDQFNGNVFHCSKCETSFNAISALRRHTAFAHGGWRQVHECPSEQSVQEVFVCSLCLRQYELMEDLRGHMIEFHRYSSTERSASVEGKPTDDSDRVSTSETVDSKALKVPAGAACLSKVESVLEMRPLPFKEFRIFLRMKMKLRCPVRPSCAYKFETLQKVEAHVKCHVETSAVEFNCSECALKLQNWRSCSSHLWKVHQQDVDLLHCPLCDFKAHASVLVWRHMRFHKKWRPRVLKSLRAVREKRQRQAKQDVEQKPSPNKNKYYSEKTCEICSRKFVNGKTLSKHVKSVHNKIKPFICNVCGKKMARKASLIIHMRQHTGEKPLQCKTCKFATRDPSVLKKHQMRHEKTGKHKCEICDYICIQTNAYKRHMRLNHPEEFKRISCDLCNFVTINEQRLREHKEDHRKGLILQVEDSQDAPAGGAMKNPRKQVDKPVSNTDISADYFLPLESIDSLPHEPMVDTGGVTIPAPSEDTQFPTYLNN